jgi:hypothetical protein
VVLLVVAGGTAAALRSWTDDDTPDPRPSSVNASPAAGASAATVPAEADDETSTPSLQAGIVFSGRTKLNTRIHASGRTRVVATCNPDCVLSVASTRGHGPVTPWIEAAMVHDYTGSGPRWRSAGTPISSCAQVKGDVFADPDRWNARMTVTEKRVSVVAVLPGFEGTSSQGGTCFVSRSTLRFTGVPVP